MLGVMAQRGYAQASIAEVGRAAGLSPGLVHYHFRNKEEILIGLVDRLGRTVRERFERFDAKARSPRERVMAFVDAALKLGSGADPDAVACWVALGTEALTRPSVGAAYRRVVGDQITLLTKLVGAALGEGGGDETRAPAIAAGVFAAIEGALRLSTIAPGVIPQGSAASTVRAMADGLLG